MSEKHPLHDEKAAMPMHDWSKVPAGIFHAFHHDWITELSRTLNRGLLPSEYYALPEQVTSKNADRFGPDVLTLQATEHRPKRQRRERFC